jgi:hypothetical protein
MKASRRKTGAIIGVLFKSSIQGYPNQSTLPHDGSGSVMRPTLALAHQDTGLGAV